MLLKVYQQIVTALSKIGIQQGDSKALKYTKNILVYLAVLMSFGGILWGTILIYFDIYLPSIVPYGYVILTFFNLLYFKFSRNFKIVRLLQISMSMLLPFALQWALGGFLSSGVMMLWSTLALIGSLTLMKGNGVYLWLALFILFTVFSVWIEPYIIHIKPDALSNNISSLLIALNVIVITSIIFVLSKIKIDQDLVVKAVLAKTNDKLSALNEDNVKKNKELITANEVMSQIQEEIVQQRDMLEDANKTLTDYKLRMSSSIKTAKTIQEAFLPSNASISKFFDEHFILFQPKDVVSGDFYWMHQADNKTIFIEADCTGHGVPGAFMTLIGNAIFNQIIQIEKIYDPATIMNKTNALLEEILQQSTTKNKDGMDLSVIVLEENENELEVAFGAANQNLFYSQNNQLQLLKGSRKRIGGITNHKKSFETQVLNVDKYSTLYLFSDGYADQNNPERRKFGSKNFAELLKKISHLSLEEQHQALMLSLKNHQQNSEQRDDITVIGLKFKSNIKAERLAYRA